jgi:hypothetical protein
MRHLIALLLPCCLAGPALAAPSGIIGSLYVEHQSNIVASTLDPESGGLARARLEVDVADMAENYAWNLGGMFSYQTYQREIFRNQFLADAAGNLRLFVLPNAIEWHFDYVEVVEDVDPGRAGQAGNEQSVQVFGTGPVLRHRLRESNELVVSLRRQRVETDFQGYYRNIGSATLWRDIRPRHRAFIEANVTQVEYGDIQPDYEIREATAGYLYEWQRLSARLEGGRSWLRQDILGDQETETGAALLRWSMPGGRQLIGRSAVSYGDEASNLHGIPDELLVGAVDSVGAFREESHALIYAGSQRVADPSLNLWHRERRYQRPVFAERDTRDTGAAISTRLHNVDSGFVLLRVSAGHRQFLLLDRLDRDYTVTISGTRYINSRSELIIGGTFFERDSTVGLSSFTNVSLFIEYRGRL